MKKISLIFLLVLLLAGACTKKEYPPDLVTESETTFYSKFRVNGTPVTIEAGRNDYYMYTSYAHDSNSVYNFIAELKTRNSGPVAPQSLRIQVNDRQPLAGLQLPDVNQALKTGDYTYYDKSYFNAYKAKFNTTYNKTAAAYTWDFGDGSKSNEANPEHVYLKAGNYTVSLKVVSTGGCVDNITNTVNIGGGTPVNAFIAVQSASGNTISFKSLLSGTSPSPAYTWDFGDGTVSTSAAPSHTYALPGSYPVKLTVKDGTKTLISNYNAVTASDISSCAANFNLVSIEPLALNIGLSSVLISWTDLNGITYTSQAGVQDLSSNFKIVSVEDFGTNEKGEPLKKLKISFACKVYNGSSVVTLDNAEAVIAVAYK